MTLNIYHNHINNCFYIRNDFDFNDIYVDKIDGLNIKVNECDSLNILLHNGYYKSRINPPLKENNTKYLLRIVMKIVEYVDENVRFYYIDNNENTFNTILDRTKQTNIEDMNLSDDKDFKCLVIASDVIDMSFFIHILEHDIIFATIKYKNMNYCIRNKISVVNSELKLDNDIYILSHDTEGYSLAIYAYHIDNYINKYIFKRNKYYKELKYEISRVLNDVENKILNSNEKHGLNNIQNKINELRKIIE
jgi:hypothetical protein